MSLDTTLVLLSGCGAKTPWSEETVPTKLYIDAPRNFAVEFPGNWLRTAESEQISFPAAELVGWQSPESRNGEAAGRLTVATLARPMGHDEMEKIIHEMLPEFKIEKRSEMDVNRRPAKSLLGATDQWRYHFILLGSPLASHVLVYAAAPEDFGRYQPQFKEMLSSFETLR
ncbi:hypothetical protein [Geoalkalibacter halelectricus]|uniref:PsbP C-terminal domain-containing protein n=1 Tax=Geoalkalibacter halelectricus TaxID=2847045 RepID=A0ABY5ZL06_9BACT|nr:hypothetical protein [Geoalkalibacter halelectricus]MDO3376810.1 hypothetical protein [Geoalkalibacter halelectricus]UWZ79124.1 hypothetical protein L9S41_15780 [Geoalkalibacter halelectricus]